MMTAAAVGRLGIGSHEMCCDRGRQETIMAVGGTTVLTERLR